MRRFSLASLALAVPLALLCGCGTPHAPGTPWSSFKIIKDGHGEGRDLVVVAWRTEAGRKAGEVRVPVTGLGRIGPTEIRLAAADRSPSHWEWDTREWQWWKEYPFEPGEMRPRKAAPASGGAEMTPAGVRVRTRFVCDDVETTEEWLFDDLASPGEASYDCIITVRNLREETLEEYGQFFACYTAWNERDKKRLGHFYLAEDGTLVNYLDRGGVHLNYYVAARDSFFGKLGRVPHCPRGEGAIKDFWKHPVSISQPTERGWRHIVMSEEARTSAISQGMRGVAQDYLLYPPGMSLAPGDSFSAHIRHLLVKVSDDELPGELEEWWAEFEADHEIVRERSKTADDD